MRRLNREEFDNYVASCYAYASDHPWKEYPDYTVYRHASNKKWFALVMAVPRSVFGLAGDGKIDVVNLKCDPLMVGSALLSPGVYPAYHMNKTTWVSVALDGTADDGTLTFLTDQSYALTAAKPKKKPKA